MTEGGRTRRDFLTILASVSTVLVSPSFANEERASDRGIGGTGVADGSDERDRDRGIGGTGVVGTIRRFGSIVVNGLRIKYPRDVVVRIDGTRAKLADLKLGHVVQVLAHPRRTGLSTHMIDVTSEVVGPVESVSQKAMIVLGQMVTLSEIDQRASWQVGDWVAVCGLRLPDATIVASLVSPRQQGTARVSGLLEDGQNGLASIGGLALDGIDPALIGTRLTVEGHFRGDSLSVTNTRNEGAELLAHRPKQLFVEAYVARHATDIRLGSGLEVVTSRPVNTRVENVVRAVVTSSVDSQGRVRVDAVRPQGRGPGFRPSGPSHPGPDGMGQGGPPRGKITKSGGPSFAGASGPGGPAGHSFRGFR